MATLYLGIEIGGTKLQVAAGVGDGSPPLAIERFEVDAARGAEGILEQIEYAGSRLLPRGDFGGVGIGFGGPIDSATGHVITSHQIAGWNDFPLVEWCQEKLQLPAVLSNDCDAAAIAEARFGAGRGESIVFFVTVGTGIGGGLVIDGRLHGAGRLASAEIGHLRPGLNANDAYRTVESLASGRGREVRARELLASIIEDNSLPAETRQNGHETWPPEIDSFDEFPLAEDALELLSRCGGDVESLTCQHLAGAAADGNRLALQVMGEASQALGWAIAQVITLLAPQVVVVGGGVSLIGEELFFEPLRNDIQRYVFPPLANSYRIVPAELGELVVVHGALALATTAD